MRMQPMHRLGAGLLGGSLRASGYGDRRRRCAPWRGDSRELFYLGGRRVWAVELTTKGDAIVAGVPKPLFDHPELLSHGGGALFSYAVARDGQHCLMTSRRETGVDGEPASAPIVVVLNWFSEVAKP